MAGEYDWTSLLGPLIGTAGSVYTSNQAANATTDAANAAAQAAQFRPVGVTTRFGKSGFQYDPATGQLIGAGYQVAPDVAAAREGLIGMGGAALTSAQGVQAFQPQVNTAAQGLFNLGQSYVGQNPQDVAQNYMNQQRQLLAPGREQQLATITNQQQQQGRLGLAVGATSAGYTVNQPQQQQQSMLPYSSVGNNSGGMQPFIGNMPPMGYTGSNGALDVANMSPTPSDYNSGYFPTPVPMPSGGGTANLQPSIQQQQNTMPVQQSQGLQATNPQMAAYYNAIAQQDAQLAANAQTYGNQQVTFGQGLMTGGLGLSGAGYNLQNTALSPYTNYAQGAVNLENQAQNALTLGSGLGSSITAGSTNAANIQNTAAGQAAALQQQRNNAVVGGLTDPVSQLIAGLTKGTATPYQPAAVSGYFGY
jgi:hypothetical protein